MKKAYIYLLSVFLVISVMYHSEDLIAVSSSVPFLLVCLGEWKENEISKVTGLIVGTIMLAYFIEPNTLDTFVPLVYFIVTLLIPSVLYWRLVLYEGEEMSLDRRASLIALSYFVLTLVVFYAIIYLTQAPDFLLTQGGEGAEALVMSASVILSFIPFHMTMDR